MNPQVNVMSRYRIVEHHNHRTSFYTLERRFLFFWINVFGFGTRLGTEAIARQYLAARRRSADQLESRVIHDVSF